MSRALRPHSTRLAGTRTPSATAPTLLPVALIQIIESLRHFSSAESKIEDLVAKFWKFRTVLTLTYSSGNPKNKHSHGLSSDSCTALPVEIRNDLIFCVNPSPLNTTIPGIGQALISCIVDGIFSSADPAPPWYLHSTPKVFRVCGSISTTSIRRTAPHIRRATCTCSLTSSPSSLPRSATARTSWSPLVTARPLPAMAFETNPSPCKYVTDSASHSPITKSHLHHSLLQECFAQRVG